MTGRGIRHLAFIVMAGFVVIILNLTYLQVFGQVRLASHPANRYTRLAELAVRRGNIYDRHGTPLAVNKPEAGSGFRSYPLGPAAAQVVGFISPTLGKSGIEEAYDRELMGVNGMSGLLNRGRRLAGLEQAGSDLVLTLDADLQRLAYDQLGGRRGAVAMVEVDTGAVLAMGSSPSYDPNGLEEHWDAISHDGQAPLFNRAIQGMYPPGSVMKIVTAAAALEVDPGLAGQTFDCPGYLVSGGRRLNCTRPHGTIDMAQAISFSCNVYFANLAGLIGGQALYRGAAGFGFNRDTPFDLPVRTTRLPAPELLVSDQLMETAIGQGDVLVTPLQMALITAAVAGNGVMLRPYLVQEVLDRKTRVVDRHRKQILGMPAGIRTAGQLREALVQAVAGGTGWRAAVPGVTVGGKTGSAENPHGDPHAWFVGFAPAERPRVSVAVVVENGGQGGSAAAPVAQALLAAATAQPGVRR